MRREKEIKVRIANTTILIDRDGTDFDLKLGPAYAPFLADDQPDLIIRLKDKVPDFSRKHVVFDSAPVWTLYRDDRRFMVRIFPEEKIPFLERVLVLGANLQSGELCIRPNPDCSSHVVDPLAYPVGEILMIHYLAARRGVILHACGVEIDGKGYLFVGVSGAGKSTIASLWNQRNVIVLSDDRVITRKRNGHFWIYGTPWHGDVKLASPIGVPLEKVFFVRHAKENTVRGFAGIEAISRYLVCSFPPFWNPEAMEFTLHLLSDLTLKVPCYDLGFVPESRALDSITVAQ